MNDVEPSTQQLRLELAVDDETGLAPPLTRSNRTGWVATLRQETALAAVAFLTCVGGAVFVAVPLALVPQLTKSALILAPVLFLIALFVYFLFGEGGSSFTTAWHFRHNRVMRDLVLPFPAWVIRRDFSDDLEFEIVHTIFSGDRDRHSDALRLRARDGAFLMRRAIGRSGAVLRGPKFAVEASPDIEAEIVPEILMMARCVASIVGAPLWVSEARQEIRLDSG